MASVTQQPSAETNGGTAAATIAVENPATGELIRTVPVLGADEIATLGDLDLNQLNDLAGRLESLENRVSLDRRALHVRIDTLQAELVDRHKTGRASVDGLLS